MSYQGSLQELRVYLNALRQDLSTKVKQNPNLSDYLQPIIYSLSMSIASIDQQIDSARRNFKKPR